MTETNNGAGAPDAAAGRSLAINAQYIKDFSFENPRAPQSLLQQQAPEVALNVDVKVQNLAPDVYEVLLLTQADAKVANETLFVIELSYAAVVTLQNVDQEALPMALLVEVPRLLFPFARAIIGNVTREGGFPPLMLQPIDFAELLRRQQEAQGGGLSPVSI
jgi:preprotein translocase subunit SecB